MKKQTNIPTAVIVILCASLPLFAQLQTAGTISSVVVYRGQALVTRTIEADLPEGSNELVVTTLPHNIISQSLYAQTPDGLRVLSVRYREKVVSEDTRKEVKEINQQIEQTNDKIYENQKRHEHLRQQWTMFLKLQEFTTQVARGEEKQPVYEPVAKLIELIQKNAQQFIDRSLEFDSELKELNKELELFQRKRNNVTAGKSRTQREAVVFVNNSKAGKAGFNLSYLVNNANWIPQYNLRAMTEDSKVRVEYNAVIHQSSGENWEGVNLSLSTAQPSMAASAPLLEPMYVGLGNRIIYNDMNKPVMGVGSQPMMMPQRATPRQTDSINHIEYRDYSSNFRQLAQSRESLARQGKKAQSGLNTIAKSNQVFELNAARKELMEVQRQMIQIARTEGISVTYELPGRLSLPSRSDQQLVTVASIECPADFTLLATPLLTDYVYLQADLHNNSNTVFLPGSAGMFRDGQFVGHADIPLVTIGQTFTGGFGIDSQIQVTRELTDKKTRIQGGNRIDTFEYRLAVNNYHDKKVKLRLLDRLPYTKDPSIKIELTKADPQLSKDGEYLRTHRDKGILRWDVNLAPNTTAQNATNITYSLTMEYDRNMQITPTGSEHD